jgi:hypothetical protein
MSLPALPASALLSRGEILPDSQAEARTRKWNDPKTGPTRKLQLELRKFSARRERMNFQVRKAAAADVPRLREVIEASVRGLQAGDYSPAQIEGALQSVYGVDSQLIADGTYFAAETATSGATRPEIVACGGWSKRKTRSICPARRLAARSGARRCENSSVFRSSGLGAPRHRHLDPGSMRERGSWRRFHAPGNGRNAERCGFLSRAGLYRARKLRSSSEQWRNVADRKDGQGNLAKALSASPPEMKS